MTVSIIIPAYNQASYLGEAIQSALAQTRSDLEVIVVDDGSTDATAAVARRYSDPRLTYVYQQNGGLSAARNTGVRLTHGELVTFLDSDDLFLPEKLALLAGELERRPELGFVAGQAVLIDENGHKLGRIFDQPAPTNQVELLLWNPFHVGSVMVRREWLERAGEFDESLRAYEDWDMWLRLTRLGCRMGWVDRPVALYRFHTQQMTQDGPRMTTATFAVLKKVYAEASLPADWSALKDAAYSQAHLRAAVHAYRAGDVQDGVTHLSEVLDLQPELKDNRASALADRLVAMTDSPKIADKLTFLEFIYDHLPAGLEDLQTQRSAHLARFAIRNGFAAFQAGDRRRARHFLLRGVKYQPAWLSNRGVLSILVRTVFS